MPTDSYFESDEFVQLLREYEEAEEKGIPCIISSDDYADIAEYYHFQGDWNHAEDVINKAIELYPDATGPLIFKARISLIRHNDANKAWHYTEMVCDKTDLDYHYMKAEILIAEKKYDEAESYLRDCYSNIEDEDSDDFPIDVAMLYADYELWQEALAWLTMSGDTEALDYKELYGRISVGLGRFDESEKIFNALLDIDPYSVKHWNMLAASQYLKGDINESLASSEFALAIDPDNEEAILNKGNALYLLDNYAEALKYYSRFCKMKPDEGGAELFQGICLLCLNRTQEGTEHIMAAEKKILPDSPRLLNIYQEIAFCLSRLGHLKEALKYIDKADRITSDHNEMLVTRGHLYLEHGQLDMAKKYFGDAIYKSDMSQNIFLRIAISIYDNGYMQSSYNIFQTLMETADDELTEGYSHFAGCCYSMGKKEEFLTYLAKAVECNPKEAKMVLGNLFPENTPPEEYIKYAKKLF